MEPSTRRKFLMAGASAVGTVSLLGKASANEQHQFADWDRLVHVDRDNISDQYHNRANVDIDIRADDAASPQYVGVKVVSTLFPEANNEQTNNCYDGVIEKLKVDCEWPNNSAVGANVVGAKPASTVNSQSESYTVTLGSSGGEVVASNSYSTTEIESNLQIDNNTSARTHRWRIDPKNDLKHDFHKSTTFGVAEVDFGDSASWWHNIVEVDVKAKFNSKSKCASKWPFDPKKDSSIEVNAVATVGDTDPRNPYL